MFRKILTLSFVFILCVQCAFSQGVKKFIYYFDRDLVSTNKDDAIIYAEGMYDDEGIKVTCYDMNKEYTLLIFHSPDSSLNVFNGSYIDYYINGKKAEEGVFKNDEKEGVWQKWDSLGFKTDSIIYKKNKIDAITTFIYSSNKKLSTATSIDSINNTLKQISYNDSGKVVTEINFKGNNGIATHYNTATNTVTYDTLTTREKREATYSEGAAGWSMLLRKNIDGLIPIKNDAPPGNYTVIIKFTVEKDGTISDIIAETNIGYGMEKEAIRVIKKSKKWNPAFQFGRVVKAYRRQPVSFVITVNR